MASNQPPTGPPPTGAPFASYVDFYKHNRKNQKWLSAPPEIKAKAYARLGIQHPSQLLQDPTLKDQPIELQTELFNAVAEEHPQWSQLNPDQRRYLRAQFFKQRMGNTQYEEGLIAAVATKRVAEQVGKEIADETYEAVGGPADPAEVTAGYQKFGELLQNPAFIDADADVRHRMFTEVARTVPLWQQATAEKRQELRKQVVENEHLPDPYRGHVETPWQSIIAEIKRGWHTGWGVGDTRELDELEAEQQLLEKTGYSMTTPAAELPGRVARAREKFAERQKKLQAIPFSKASEAIFDGSATAEDKTAYLLHTLKTSPWDLAKLAAETGVSSLVSYGMSAGALMQGGAAAGGPAGMGAGAGLGSFYLESSTALVDSFRQAGVDVTDPDDLERAFKDPKIIDAARQYATQRGLTIALFDGLTAGYIGRLSGLKNGLRRAAALSPAVSKKVSFRALREVALQSKAGLAEAVGSGAGEMAAQYLTEGKISDPLGVFLEITAGLPQGAVETVAARVPGAVRGVAKATRTDSGIGKSVAEGLREAGKEARGEIDVLGTAELQAKTRRDEGQAGAAPERALWARGIDPDTQVKLDNMNETDRRKMETQGLETINRRLLAFMDEHGLQDPGEIPEGVISDVGAEVFEGLVTEYEKGTGPIGEGGIPAEEERTTDTTTKQWKDKARAAKTVDELDEIEANWKKSDRGPGGRYEAKSVGERMKKERERILKDQAAAAPPAAPETPPERHRAWVTDPATGKRTIQWVEEPAPTTQKTAPEAPPPPPPKGKGKGKGKAPAAVPAAETPPGVPSGTPGLVIVAEGVQPTSNMRGQPVEWTDPEDGEYTVGELRQARDGHFYMYNSDIHQGWDLPPNAVVNLLRFEDEKPPTPPTPPPKKKGRPKKPVAPIPEPVTPEPEAGFVERRAENRTYRDELWDRSPAWLVGEPAARSLWVTTADPETVLQALEADELGNPQPIEPGRRRTLINELQSIKGAIDRGEGLETKRGKAEFIKVSDAKKNIRDSQTADEARAHYEEYLAGVRDNPDQAKKPVPSVKGALDRKLEAIAKDEATKKAAGEKVTAAKAEEEAKAKRAEERKAKRAARRKPPGEPPPEGEGGAPPTETTPEGETPPPPPKPKKPRGKKAAAAPTEQIPEPTEPTAPAEETTTAATPTTPSSESSATEPAGAVAPPAPKQPKTAKELEAQLMKARGKGITKEQVKATMALIAARAKALGKSADEFVRERILGVSEEKPTGPLVLWQTNAFPGASIQGPLSRAATNNLFLKSRRLIEGQTQKKWVGAQLYGWLQKQGISQTELEYLRLDELLEGSTEKVETDDVLTWIDRNFTLAIGEQGGIIGFGEAPVDPDELKAYQAESRALASYLQMIEDAKLPVAGRIDDDSATTWYEFDMHYGALTAVREHIKNNWIPETREGNRTGAYGPPDGSDEHVRVGNVRGVDGKKIILEHEDLMRVYTAEMTRRQEAYRKFLFDPKKLAEAIAVRHESEWHQRRGIQIVTPLEGAADTARLNVSSDGTTITMTFALEPPSDLRDLETILFGKIFDARRMKDGTVFTTTNPEEAEKYFNDLMEDALAASRDIEADAIDRADELQEKIDELKSRARPEGRYPNLVAGGMDEEGNNYFEVFVGDTAAWPTFRDGHWRDIPNTIMWIRGDVREIVINGKPIKVVYLHEQQGDLHKAAHHKVSQRARDIAAQQRIPIEQARKEGAARRGPYARRFLGPVPAAARWEDLSGEDLVRHTVVRPKLDPSVSRAIGHATARGVVSRMVAFVRGSRETPPGMAFDEDAHRFLTTGETGRLTQDEMAAVTLNFLERLSSDGNANRGRLRPVMAKLVTNWDGGPIEDHLKTVSPTLFDRLRDTETVLARDVFSSAYRVIAEVMQTAAYRTGMPTEREAHRQRARDVIGEVSEALYMEYVLGAGDWPGRMGWTKADIARIEKEARVFGDHVRWLLGLNVTAEIEDRSDPERGSKETVVRGFSTMTNAQEMTTRFQEGQKSNRGVIYPEEKFPYVPYRSANDQAAIALKIALSLAERLGVEGVAWAGGNLQHNLWYKALAGRNSPTAGSIDVIEAATPWEWRAKVDETIHQRSGQDEWTIPEAGNRSTPGVGRSYLVTTTHKDAGTTHQVFDAESGTNITDAYDTLAQWQQDGMEITALLKPETLKELEKAGPGPFRELTPDDYVTSEDGFTQVYDTLMTRVMEKLLKSLGIKQRVEHGVDEKLQERLKAMEESHGERAQWWRPEMAEAGISHFVRLSPADLNAVQDRGLPYMQRSNAAVQFDAENRAMIHLFGEARNVSSLVHEVGHIFRRDLSDLSPTQLETLETWAEVKGHRWTVKADEKFANAWEKYLRDGKAPTSELAKVFETFKKWMLNIYKTIKGSELDIDVPPEIAAIFDAMLGKEAEEVPEPTSTEPVEAAATEETVEARGPPSPFPNITALLEDAKTPSGFTKSSAYRGAIARATTAEELDFIADHVEAAGERGLRHEVAIGITRSIAKRRAELAGRGEPGEATGEFRERALTESELLDMLKTASSLASVREIYGMYQDDLATEARTAPSTKFEKAHKAKLSKLRIKEQRRDLAQRLGERKDWPVGKRDWPPVEAGTFIGVGKPFSIRPKKGEGGAAFKAREMAARIEYAADQIQYAWFESTRRLFGEGVTGRVDPWFVAHALDAMKDEYQGDVPFETFKNEVYDYLNEEQGAVDHQQWVARYLADKGEGSFRDFERAWYEKEAELKGKMHVEFTPEERAAHLAEAKETARKVLDAWAAARELNNVVQEHVGEPSDEADAALDTALSDASQDEILQAMGHEPTEESGIEPSDDAVRQREIERLAREQQDDEALDNLRNIKTVNVDDLVGTEEEPSVEPDPWRYQRGSLRFWGPKDKAQLVEDQTQDIRDQVDAMAAPPEQRNWFLRKFEPAKIGRWRRQNFTGNRGLASGLYEIMVGARAVKSAGTTLARITYQQILEAMDALASKYDADKVRNAITWVAQGKMPIEQFKRIFNIDDAHPAVLVMREVKEVRDDMRRQLLEIEGLPERLRQAVENNEDYMTRFYMAHILGEHFNVDQASWQAARRQIYDQLQQHLNDLTDRGTKLIGEKKPFDIITFLRADSDKRRKMVEKLSKTKARDLLSFGLTFDPYMQFMETLEVKGGRLQASHVKDLLIQEAEHYLAQVLENARDKKGMGFRGPDFLIPVANQLHRELDANFRKLLGQVESPAERIARTLEAQNNILATGLMFQQMYREGKGIWWADDGLGKFTKRLSESPHPHEPVTNADRRRYGAMAGKFVSPETYDFMHSEGTFDGALSNQYFSKIALDLQARTRAMRLLWPKTMFRNAVSSVVGFALRSGDAFRPGWAGHWAEGWKLYHGIVKKDKDALRQLMELQRKGVFDYNQETMLNLIEEQMKTWAKPEYLEKMGATRSGLHHLMQYYALIDLPAKYAAYKVELARNGGDERAAVDHVHTFYQYSQRVPEIIHKLNKLPFGDYVGYTYDSTRIWSNATKNVATSALKGDVAPLFGYLLSATMPVASLSGGVWLASLFPQAAATSAYFLGNALSQLLQAVTFDDDDLDKLRKQKFRPATDAEVMALRATLPSYDRFAPIVAWYVTDPNGQERLVYKIIANTNAFPMEEVVLGALQSALQEQAAGKAETFTRTLSQNLFELGPFAPGMTLETVNKMWNGRPGKPGVGHLFKTTHWQQSMQDPWVEKASDTGEIIGRSIWEGVGMLFVPGQGKRVATDILQIVAGRDPAPGNFKQKATWADVRRVVADPVRTYELTGTEQFALLERATRETFENLRLAKIDAGIADRAGIAWQGGPTDEELRKSQQGRQDWWDALKRLERRVQEFKTYSAGNWPDDYLVAVLQDNGNLKRAEAKALVEGKVDQLPATNFETPQRTSPIERGAHLVREAARSGAIDMEALYRQLRTEGYHFPGSDGGPDSWVKFSRWVRAEQKKIRDEELGR